MREALETDSRLNPAEVKQELEKMSPADWVRVERLAKWARQMGICRSACRVA